MSIITIDSFTYNDGLTDVTIGVSFNDLTETISWASDGGGGGTITEAQRDRVVDEYISTYVFAGTTYVFYAQLTAPYAYFYSSEDPPEPEPEPIPEDFEYQTFYEGEFCDYKGEFTTVWLQKRVAEGTIPIIPKEIFFGAQVDKPVLLSYLDEGDYKLNPINGSELTLSVVSALNFELSNIFPQDEREWLVSLAGGSNFVGYLIPDDCNEPFMDPESHYIFTLRATDYLGTLKDILFEKEDLVKYRGFMSDREILRLCLEKTGLGLRMRIAVNTMEENMDPLSSNGALGQAYVNTARFIDQDRNSLNCYDVMASILRRWSARLHQVGGFWQVVNVLEASSGSVFCRQFSTDGFTEGSLSLGDTLIAGGQTRLSRPVGNVRTAKGLLSSTAYYQYGYLANSLYNGDFNEWTSKPTGLPDDWVSEGVSASTGIRQFDGVDTLDYFLIIEASAGSFVRNDNVVQVRGSDKVTVSFDLYSPDSFDANPFAADRLVPVRIMDGSGNYYTDNNGWQNTAGVFYIRYKAIDMYGQKTVSFEIPRRNSDYTIQIGFASVVQYLSSTRYRTNINNVSISPSVEDSAIKPPLGDYDRLKQRIPQTATREAILLLHADELNDIRTSQIRIYTSPSGIPAPSLPTPTSGVPSFVWARSGKTEERFIKNIAALSELVLHQRPYKVLEFTFYGNQNITPNTLLTVDLIPGQSIFLSGDFDVKGGVHVLRFASTLTTDPVYDELIQEDFGAIRDKEGKSVGLK